MSETTLSGTINLTYSSNTFTYSGTSSGTISAWPIIINGASTITFLTDILIISTSQYFDVKSDDVTFDGNGHTATISNVISFNGLIKNGTGSSPTSFSSPAFMRCTIKNINIHSDTSTLNSTSKNGWLCQVMFGVTNISTPTNTNCMILNCSSDGVITSQGGGIGGATCYYTTFSNCFSTGSINSSGGGITGKLCLNCTVNNCYTTGMIATSAGGIFGSNSASCTANNCYTIGTITTSGNGIFGSNSSGSATNNCVFSGTDIWSDSSANETISKNINSGDLLSTYSNGYNQIWTDISPTTTNTPYKLTIFNLSPYVPQIKSVNPGQTYTSSTPSNTGSYSIVEINGNSAIPASIDIDSFTGIITFSLVPLGTYVILIYYVGSNNNYSVSTYTLESIGCLAKGTKIIILIDNKNCECNVEDLKPGDFIKTTHGTMKIKFITAYNVYDINFIRKIKKNSIDTHVPYDDLYLTKNHGILLDEKNYNIYANTHKKRITIDNHFKLLTEHFIKSECLKDNDLNLPIICYNILLHDENKKESRNGIYANGLLVESMRPL